MGTIQNKKAGIHRSLHPHQKEAASYKKDVRTTVCSQDGKTSLGQLCLIQSPEKKKDETCFRLTQAKILVEAILQKKLLLNGPYPSVIL